MGTDNQKIAILTAFVLATLGSNGALWSRIADLDVDTTYSTLVPQMEQVLTDHGTEFAHVRNDIQQLRGEMLTLTDDRFRRTDWNAQRQILDLQLSNLKADMLRCKNALDIEQ